jgi:glutaminase
VASWISTGRLPTDARVAELVAEAHRRFSGVSEGKVATYIPALASANPAHFGLAVATTGGTIVEAGEAMLPFSIQSISKPFLYALVCQAIGEREAREKLGVNSTGLPFNSVQAVERAEDSLSNPMVNAGAMSAVALISGRLQRSIPMARRRALIHGGETPRAWGLA